MTKEDIELAISIFSGLISLGVLGFLIKLILTLNAINRERAAVQGERIALAKDETNLFRSKNYELEKEVDKLRALLDDKNITVKEITENTKTEFDENLFNKIQTLSDNIQELSNKSGTKEDYEFHISLGEAFYYQKIWSKAAHHFHEATKIENNNWEVSLSKAVSYANMKENSLSNTESLKAYHETISLFPSNMNIVLKSRIYIYLGALQKRLGRLDEAEVNINYGLSIAQNRLEITDGLYNRACIYALKNQKKEMIQTLIKLNEEDDMYFEYIDLTSKEYFTAYRNDSEFINIVKNTSA